MVRLRPAAHCGDIAIVLALGAAVAAEAGDILFRPARLDFETRGSGVLALGNLDGDGIPDAAIPAGYDGVGIHLGNGDGTFGPAVYYGPTGISARAVSLGDFDGDEIPDLAVANFDDVSILLGVGNGTFGPETRIPMDGGSYRFVAVGDLDGDGALDVAATGWNRVAVARGRGDGTFHPADHYSPGLYPRSVAIADLDADEIPDLAVANQGSDDVSVLRGVGDGTFGIPESWPAGDGPEGVAIGDLDGNGIPDLVVVSLDDGVAVLIGQGNASFLDPTFYPTGGTGTFVTLEDMDGDSTVDIIATSYGSPGGAWIFPGHGDGTFGDAALSRTRLGPSSAAVGDVDRDGFLDLAASAGQLSVFLGAGPDGLADTGFFPVGAPTVELALGFLDGDEVRDLVAATEEGVSVLRGRGDGTFEGFVPYAAGVGPVALAIDDFDRDGEADLVVVNGGSNTVSFLRGRGDATFEDAIHRDAGLNPRSLATGDFDGDASPDLAITNSMNVGILAGNGDGTFASPVFYPIDIGSTATGEPGPVATADFDGDGILDLAVGRPLGGGQLGYAAVAILRGQGDGTFGAARFFKIGNTAVSDLALDDLDGDGAVDIVAARFHLTVLWGQGDCTFRRGEVHDPRGSIRTVATGDFDGDGRVDVASVSSANGNLSVMRNRGALGSGANTLWIDPPQYGTCFHPQAVATGDLDGDGMPDVAVASPDRGDVAILLGATPAGRRATILTSDSHPGPRPSRLTTVSPNPFRTTTVVRFSLASPEAARLEIFNVLGQRVRTLVDARLLPGSHLVAWDGLDEAGRAVAPGVYLVRLQAGAVSASSKVARLRR